MALPKLRSDLEVSRQDAGGTVQIVVRDPANGNVYSFPEKVFTLLGMADGDMDVNAIADRFFERPTVDAERSQVAKLYEKALQMGLLADGSQEKQPEKKPSKSSINRGGLLWRLLDMPLGRGSAAIARGLGVLFGAAAPVAIVLMCVAAYGLALRSGDYFGMLQVFFQYAFWPETVLWLILSMAWHELGHLTAARRYGSRTSRVGAGLYLFMPTAFIRIDDFFMIQKRWQRVVVALGGVYFDLISISIALLVWTYSPNYSHASQVSLVISYVLLFRILFNVLPFLRLDGYWAFSEAIGIRKLRDESLKALISLVPGLASVARPSPRFGSRARTAMAIYGLVTTVLFIGSLVWSYRHLANLLAGWSPEHALALKIGLAITMMALVATSLLRDFSRALGVGFRRT